MSDQSSKPAYAFDFAGGVSSRGMVERQLLSGSNPKNEKFGYVYDDLPLALGAGSPFTPSIADLLDVAAAVSLADRLSPRSVQGDLRPIDNRWKRRIHVRLPVRLSGFWSTAEIQSLLDQILYFLSGDEWTFEFVSRTIEPSAAETQRLMLSTSFEAPRVILQSGGLDSLAGLVGSIKSGTCDGVIPVTVLGNSRLRLRVAEISRSIRRNLNPGLPIVQPTLMRLQLSQIGWGNNNRESSQRLRGFLFIAAGVATAVSAKAPELAVSENGIGAISLQMTSDHWGARATKAMHPKTLVLIAELTSRVLDRAFSIKNLSFFSTKAELVGQFLSGEFAETVDLTASCDRANYLSPGKACGKCTSCILRRASLTSPHFEAHKKTRPIEYEFDVFDTRSRWRSEDILPLVAMRAQIEQLRNAVAGEHPSLSQLSSEFPSIMDVMSLFGPEGMDRRNMEQRVIRLYQAYVREFDGFIARIDRPDWGLRAEITQIAQPLISAAG